ncbi:MAG: efflux RND transporter permease subunit [Lysobacteraceae bacterium]
MKFSASTWAIKNPIPPILLFMLLTLAGVIAFVEMPVTNLPNVVIPVVSVRIDQPGATPSELETQVARRVEGALAAIPGVRHITSTITEGTSLTTLEFDIDVDVDRAVNDTRNAVSQVRQDLPQTVREPYVQRAEDNGASILTYSVESPGMAPEALGWFVDDRLSRELLSIQGVSRVVRNGGADEEVSITLDPAVLSSLGVTAADVSRQLGETYVEVPGGHLTLRGVEYSLRTLGKADTIAELGAIRILLPNGGDIALGDLGRIRKGAAEARTISRIDGKPAVTFAIYKSLDASEVSVAHKIQERLDSIAESHKGMQFKEVFSTVTTTERGYRSTMYTFLEGALLTILVVFLFLRDARATIIAAIAIPFSIIPTFLCMEWLGFTLNFVSTVAISLVTGVLVDDAIVEIENIHRHMRNGRNPFDAAIAASEEIGLSVVATTLVICAIFVPVSFMDGIAGLYFKQFGLTVAIAAFFSLLVARLLTPMLASRLLRKPPEDDAHGRDGPFMAGYLRIVDWTLRHRVKTLVIAIFTVALSIALVPLLPTGFMPYQDFSEASITIELPRGSTLEQTDAAAQNIVKRLRARPEVKYVLTTAGEMSGGINLAKIVIKLVPPEDRELSEREFANTMQSQLTTLPDVRVTFDNSIGSKDVSIVLVGEDVGALTRTAESVEREMRSLPGLSSVGGSNRQQQREILIEMDSVKAAKLGITAQQVGDAISISTIGDDISRLPRFNEEDREIPIRVRLPRDFGSDLSMLLNLKLLASDGRSIPLSSVATLRYGLGPATIKRYDRQREISVEANLNGVSLGTAMERIQALKSMRELPASVSVLNTGDAEFMEALMISFLKAMIAGLLMVYSIQVLLYKDWLQPLARMTALPLSIGGAFLLLFVTRTELGLPAMIGVLMLMGIADKNSILLVDHMLEQMRAGASRRDAILASCRVRARPIVMTSFAMAAGMMPTAIGIGLDAAFRAPMAIAVIGGLISSTALSLLFMPVIFSYVRGFEEWMANKFRSSSWFHHRSHHPM